MNKLVVVPLKSSIACGFSVLLDWVIFSVGVDIELLKCKTSYAKFQVKLPSNGAFYTVNEQVVHN